MTRFDDPAGAMPPPDDDPRRPLSDDGPDASAPLDAAGGEPTEDAPEPGGSAELSSEPAYDPHRPVREPDESLDRRVVVYWLVSGMISWGFMALLIGGGCMFVYMQATGGGGDAAGWAKVWSWTWKAAIVLLGPLLVWALISPSLAWTRWRFAVDSELLVARYGILFIEEKAIPISRLQHVDLYRGFLERIFGIGTLIVFTAGTEGAHFRLPGLSVQRARELRDLIIAARGDDVI